MFPTDFVTDTFWFSRSNTVNLNSPFFFLNTLVAMAPTKRAAFGYAPPTDRELRVTSKDDNAEFFDWPRRPMIVPPLMVNDFNFSALVDAV